MSIFIIAEIGINHNGDINLAKKLIEGAKKAGADAVKFQKRTIEHVYTEEALKSFMDSATQQNSLLGLYDTFVGGFFSQASIFTLGIMPYISSYITHYNP